MKNWISLSLLFLVYVSCNAQQTDQENIAGIWKGTSLCQVKNSPCHDETVVYYVSKRENSETQYLLKANKIVNGTEEEMGDLDFVYDKQKQTLTCNMVNKQGKSGTWLFHLDGNKIHGSLTVDGNTLFRLIEVEKK